MTINIPVFTKIFSNDYFYIILIIKVLVLIFPCNILIKYIMPVKDKNKSKITKKEELELKNGWIIGTLERLLMLSLLYLGQAVAIGLVLTCKSITRYKQLEEQEFAERYLIGTLASTLITIVIYII